MNKRLTRVSKYLTFILKHDPKSISLVLDSDGFADIDELVRKANVAGKAITTDQVRQVIEQNEENRYRTNAELTRIAVSR